MVDDNRYKAYGVSVSQVAVTFNDPNGSPVPPKNPDRLPLDIAAEYSGEGTAFPTPEDALKGRPTVTLGARADGIFSGRSHPYH